MKTEKIYQVIPSNDSLGSVVFKDAAAFFFELGVVEAALLPPKGRRSCIAGRLG